MFRRRLVSDVPQSFKAFDNLDWLLYIKLACEGWIGYIDELMGVYRVHPGGVWTRKAPTDQLEEDIRAYQFLLSFLPSAFDASIREQINLRRTQLAVEQIAVPYDRGIAVLTDRPSYLSYNGRSAFMLTSEAFYSPEGPKSRSVELIQRLEQVRRDGTGFLIVPSSR